MVLHPVSEVDPIVEGGIDDADDRLVAGVGNARDLRPLNVEIVLREERNVRHGHRHQVGIARDEFRILFGVEPHRVPKNPVGHEREAKAREE